MSPKKEPNFWLNENKTLLSNTLNRIASYKVPLGKPVEEEKRSPSNSYIRMEQIEKATHQYSYSAFLNELEKHAPLGTAKNVSAADLFIRSLRPDVNVNCSFNSLLKVGAVELVRHEQSVKVLESMCPELEAIQGKSIILSKRIRFELSYHKNCLLFTNVDGLTMGMDVFGNYLQSPIQRVNFRSFESDEYLQVFYAENPLHKLKPDMCKQLSFIRASVF